MPLDVFWHSPLRLFSVYLDAYMQAYFENVEYEAYIHGEYGLYSQDPKKFPKKPVERYNFSKRENESKDKALQKEQINDYRVSAFGVMSVEE